VNTTLEKFGYPGSLIKSYEYWNLLLRPGQITLGSLILICKESVHQYSGISQAAMSEQKLVVSEIEQVLKHRFNYSKINYQMLMMQDPDVHFHIIPRYDAPVDFCGTTFEDVFWPKISNMSFELDITDVHRSELLRTLKIDFAAITLSAAVSLKKYEKMYTSGCFDIFHQGHLNILKSTKALCDYLVVGVSTDELILKSKGRLPLIPFEERVSILESNKYVDEVIPQVDKNKQTIVDQYNIDAISVGSDWFGKYPKVTCEMEYFDYTPNVSSTVLKQKLNITS
jgi:glycerol-3-phosphate cytidylyltransferase